MPAGNPAVVFRHSETTSQKLRIGLMLDRRHVPAYARAIIEDLKATSYVQIVAIFDSRAIDNDLVVRQKVNSLLRAYFQHIEARAQTAPDPLAITDVADLLSDIGTCPPDCSVSLDVALNFSDAAVTPGLLSASRCGVWRYQFGDSRHYPGGSGFLRELVDRNPLSAVELVRQTAGNASEEVLCRAEYSTSAFPSMRLNRIAPIWGARHLMLQKLWELHHLGSEVLSKRSAGTVEPCAIAHCSAPPGNLRLALWFARLALAALWRRLRATHRTVHWKIAIRRSPKPLYEEPTQAALGEFRWLESPRGHFWADPFLFEQAGQTWLFFEDMDHAAGRAHIACGRLTADGALVDVRPILIRHYHLSYPQVFSADGEVYLLPEAAESGGVELYRAISFPDQWVLECRLLNFSCVDTVVFRSASGWEMYTSPMVVAGHAPITWAMHADQLRGPWQYSSHGPIASHAGTARGAGAVFQSAGRRIRPSQDCATAYGSALLFNEILEPAGETYKERVMARVGGGWLPGLVGVHTYNRCGLWEVIDGKFLVAVGSEGGPPRTNLANVIPTFTLFTTVVMTQERHPEFDRRYW